MRRISMWCAAALLLPAASAFAQNPPINGLAQVPYVFNDFPGTTLVIVDDDNPNGGNASITETNYVDDMMAGNFTNRHVIDLSSDGGATSATFNIDSSWSFSTVVTLPGTSGPGDPAEEAGIIIRSPITGDAQFIVKTNGEIVAFGGPFYLAPDVYTPGTPIELTMTMTSGGDGIGGAPNFLEFAYDSGIVSGSSGPLLITNLESGFLSYSLGVYGQLPPTPPLPSSEVKTALFNNITFTPIPEPATIGLGAFALLGLTALRRRSR